MRVWFSGPRVMGIRPGISLGREDFGAPLANGQARVGSVLLLRFIQAVATLVLIGVVAIATVAVHAIFAG